jgi:hypothetical protein
LSARDGQPWAIDEAAYLAFSGKKSYVPIVPAGGSRGDDVLGRRTSTSVRHRRGYRQGRVSAAA